MLEAESSVTIAAIKKFKMTDPFDKCTFNIYEGSDASKVVKEDLATDEWYKNEENYDY